jgi:hypothetical protein
MDSATARSLAHQIHLDQRGRTGRLLTEHVERVAAAVPPEARSVAYLHDVLERVPTALADLVARGLTPLERDALELLTREATESYELYVLRVAHAEGPSGALARIVKLADLDDHLEEPSDACHAPPYAWARRHMSFASELRDGHRPAEAA